MSGIDPEWLIHTENGKRYHLANVMTLRFFGTFDQRVFQLNEQDSQRLKEWNQNLRNSGQLTESNKDIIKHVEKIYRRNGNADEYLAILQLLEVE